jgi:heme-degrading monooxygenase HmoA
MFAVIFEVAPKPERWDDYLREAGMLRPRLERIDGFIANERYASLQRKGWVLSLSIWRNEKAVVRWRTVAQHHETQEKGRFEIFADYHLRVGEITADSGLPAGEKLAEDRRDETEIGDARYLALSEQKIAGLPDPPDIEHIATRLGLPVSGARSQLVAWDVFRHLVRGDEYLLLTAWRTSAAAGGAVGEGRHRQVRVVRDYGMFDRREAPQYYPPVAREQVA